MFGVDIERLLGNHPITKSYYAGCFSADTLPRRPNKLNFGIVVNLDPSNLPGSHWVAIFARGNVAFYFDSFGLRPSVPSICKWLYSKFKVVHWNSVQHQKNFTETCGGFAIFFIYQMSLGKSFREVIDMFKVITNDDQMVVNFMWNVFKYQLELC